MEGNAITALVDDAESAIGTAVRARVVHHLVSKVERERFPEMARTPRTEQQALAMIRGVATELRQAGKALALAALQLNDAGKGRPANLAHQAAQRAEHLANELVPEHA
jgi:hypothetical protein